MTKKQLRRFLESQPVKRRVNVDTLVFDAFSFLICPHTVVRRKYSDHPRSSFQNLPAGEAHLYILSRSPASPSFQPVSFSTLFICKSLFESLLSPRTVSQLCGAERGN